jgi:D-aminopeptidase
MKRTLAALAALLLAAPVAGQARPRARDLGVPSNGTPGPHNAITDVAGVEVGHTTLVSGSGPLVVGKGPVRTGVTAVLPRGRGSNDPVFAGWFSLNGNGEMTGTAWIDESGFLEGPVLITNTHSVGGGTGMICHGFKGGIGTASRRLAAQAGGYTVGVLVQCNYGSQRLLRIAGVPVGEELTEPGVCRATDREPVQAFVRNLPRCGPRTAAGQIPDTEAGSIIIVVATDAPLLPHQLERLVTRTSLGLGRHGSIASNSSGDIFVAFSTANPRAAAAEGTPTLTMLPNDRIDPLFLATVQATEEAITNAMIAAETMTGADDVRAYALPHDRLREVLKKYNRLAPSAPR